jgi:hypothetical protein
MYWRLTLDCPYVWPTEAAYLASYHCTDFLRQGEVVPSIYQDPITHLVMIRPNYDTSGAASDTLPVTAYTYQADYWRGSYDSHGRFTLSPIKKAGVDPTLIEKFIKIAIYKIVGSIPEQDTVLWAVHTTQTLKADEGWIFSWIPISDEYQRKEDWVYLQWDNIGIHIGQAGRCRVLLYDRSDMTKIPVLVEEFSYGRPEDLVEHGMISFIPVPGVGLLFHTKQIAPGAPAHAARAELWTTKGHLIRLPTTYDADGTPHITQESTVHIALNPWAMARIGVGRVTYDTSGIFVDQPRELGMPAPTQSITVLPAGILPPGTNIVGAANNPDGTPYEPGSTRYRAQLTLTSTNNWLTPFVTGYTVSKPSVVTSRNTTPIVLSNVSSDGTADRLLHLEWSQDERDRFEGRAVTLLQTAGARRIAERADTVFKLEQSADNASWTTLFGGIARKPTIKPIGGAGPWTYIAEWTLQDIWSRFDEVRVLWAPRQDNMKVGDAINQILSVVGFQAISPVPDAVNAVVLPKITAPDLPWQFAPREGDSLEQMLEMMLVFLRRQFVDWKMPFDWDNAKWNIVQRSRDVSAYWTLDPRQGTANANNRVWEYGTDTTLRPEPPEGTSLMLIGRATAMPITNTPGVSTGGSNTIALISKIENPGAGNPASLDYAGRNIPVLIPMHPINDQAQLDVMARRLFDMIMHRALVGTVSVPIYQPNIVPGTPVKLLDTTGTPLSVDAPNGKPAEADILWVKRRTVTVDCSNVETEVLELNSVWEALQ